MATLPKSTPKDTLAFLDDSEVLPLLEGGNDLATLLKETDELVEEFERHIVRSQKSGTTRAAWKQLRESVRIGSSDPTNLLRFNRQVKLTLEQSRKERLENTLFEALLSLGNVRDLIGNPLREISEHRDFLLALSKRYKLQKLFETAESVDSGLHVFLTEAETTRILKENPASFDGFALSNGYHCVKRGDTDDITYGHSGSRVSKWVFLKI